MSALKDVQAQLGPIGAAIQTKLAATEDEETRKLMGEQKALAVDLYNKLQVGWGEGTCTNRVPAATVCACVLE